MDNYFSIYKIDTDFVWKEILYGGSNPVDLDYICKSIIKTIKTKAVESGPISEFTSKNYNDYLVVYEKDNKPLWYDSINRNFPDFENSEISSCNKSLSFVMLSIVDENIYATTGGYASSYIKGFIVKNFGLNILPKVYTGNESVIQELTENNMIGWRQTASVTNRNYTNFDNERGFSKIFKKINAKAGSDLLKKFGIDDIDDEKKYSIISTDALNIRKMMSMKEYKKTLLTINNIDNKKPNFPLSFYSDLKTKGITKTKAIDALCEKIIDEKSNNEFIDEIRLVGTDYSKYISANEWIAYYEGVKILHKTYSAIEFQEIFSIYEEKIKPISSISSAKDFFKKS